MFADFLIEHNYHIFSCRISDFLSDYKTMDYVIDALIMSNFYDEKLNRLSNGYNMLSHTNYWNKYEDGGELADRDGERTDDEIREQVLQWATERSM